MKLLAIALSLFAVTGQIFAVSPYTGSSTVFIPFANADTNQTLDNSPTIVVGFDNKDRHTEFIMDTGSVGIVASKDLFTPAHDAKNLGKGHQYYTSSGIIEEGTWWSATQQFYDKDGNLLATAEVPVLQVTSITCAQHARSCTPNDDPKGISVMGIGFARESAQQPRGTPNYNAFLNLKRIRKSGKLKKLPADWCNGYVVTPNGVYLGITASNTEGAGFVKLEPWQEFSDDDLNEWHAAPMTLLINEEGQEGNILMDTGVGTAYVSPPTNATVGTLVTCPDVALVECAPNGDVFEIYLPDQTNPIAYYHYTVGECDNPMQPNGNHVVQDSNVFLNTSRHVLDGFNIVYDNTNGYIGYVWNGNSSDTIGYVHPALKSSSVTLMPSDKSAKVDENITFFAQVSVHEDEIPTGGVSFFVDGTIQYVPLDSTGGASYTTSFNKKGTYTIRASYSGDNTYQRSNTSKYRLKVK